MTAPKFMLGRKVGMTHIYRGDGEAVPVTVISAGPCSVSMVRTMERDGYHALQVAYEDCREKVLTKAQLGHLKTAGLEPKGETGKPRTLRGRVLREVRLDEPSELSVGDEFKCDVFEAGEKIDVIGTVKGRGFAGTIRAHNFNGKRRTHGSMNRRGPGAIGMHSQPGEVLKGQRMATHWGDERATTRNLEVVDVDPENNAIAIRGSVPGARGSLVVIRAASAWRKPKE